MMMLRQQLPVPALLLLILSAVVVSASSVTKVVVLEFGKGGAVRTTADSNPTQKTSARAVQSFWSNLHRDDTSTTTKQGNRHKTLLNGAQHPGMSLVPDFFHRADGGLIVGLTGVDLDEMAFLRDYITHDAVGGFTLAGSQSAALLSKAPESNRADFAATLQSRTDHALDGGRHLAARILLAQAANAEVDRALATVLTDLRSRLADDTTFVVHLVIEEDPAAARRRKLASRLSRRLEDEESEDEDEDEEDDEKEDENGEGDDDGNNNANNGNGYNSIFYGYSYTTYKGETYTPWRTIFQIQYHNIVLWSGVGLVSILYVSLYMMLGMPLLPDTLLFGESAKMMGSN